MSKKLEGKVALVTGGSSGIGLATAQRFVAEGAYVYITGRRKAELDAAVKKIGSHVTGVQADVSKAADLDRVIEVIQKDKGRIDTIFANAGGGTFLPLGAITEQQYHDTFDTNVKGVILTVQKALPLLPNGATIVLNASTAASTGMPAFSVYSATKAAVRSFARTWTTDLADRGIRVNVVSPGPVDTAMLAGHPKGTAMLAGHPEGMEVVASRVSMGRLGRPEEIAKTVTFLASDDASFMTGDEVFVDGGAGQV